MEYRKEVHDPILSVAPLLFKCLNEAGLRYGIFKSSRNTAEALLGDQDLDILVAREDYRAFCEILSRFQAIRSVNHGSLTSLGREDWFVPDFEQFKYLHLDVHTGIRLGEKFGKKYALYAYSQIQHWPKKLFGSCAIPIASSEDEARITLSRIAFRTKILGLGAWVKLKGNWKTEIDELLFVPGSAAVRAVTLKISDESVQCRVWKDGDDIWVNRRELLYLRQLIRQSNAASPHSVVTDWLQNAVKAARYLGERMLNRIVPGLSIDRRCPVTGGLIVAIVGPDGMGKSTQVKRMRQIFSFKFSCVGLYLGSGDGEGWWLRRLIRSFYIQRRSKIKGTFLDEQSQARKQLSLKKRLGAYLLELWGVLIALERYSAVRKAQRKARRGFIVFCDRWPQSLRHGFLDGPTKQYNRRLTWMRKWELSIYRRIARFHPDIMIQLIADYSVSAARKPGELQPEEFENRLDLMAEIRKMEPQTEVLDAGHDLDSVSRSIFRLIWGKL